MIELQNLDDVLPPSLLATSYNMGWQTKAGSRVYYSVSGHGFLIGCRSKKVVCFGALKKNCSTCEAFNKNNEVTPDHRCNVNHAVSSGSMQ